MHENACVNILTEVGKKKGMLYYSMPFVGTSKYQVIKEDL